MLFMKSQDRQIHQHIRREIERRLSRSGAPQEIRVFLLERWALLLHGIYTNHGDAHPDWEAGWHSVNALLWSMHPKQPGKETQQFLRLLPTLLSRLQEGCEAMGLPQEERDRLFSQLALMHAAVVRGGLQGDCDDDGPDTQFGLDDELDMGEEELIGLVSDDEDGQIHVPITNDAKISAPVSTTDHAGAIGSLQVGDAVYFKQAARGETPLTVQWISPMGGMYLFADEIGSNALSLTLARLAEKFAAGDAWRTK